MKNLTVFNDQITCATFLTVILDLHHSQNSVNSLTKNVLISEEDLPASSAISSLTDQRKLV